MYIKPFETKIWIAIIVTLSACGLMLALTGIREDGNDYNLGLSWFITLHGIFNQGAPGEPGKHSSRF